ncbi:MAG: hypothetical protein ACO3VF_03645 [Tamlana sp.]
MQNGKENTYKLYVSVQNEITEAYYELRNTYSLNVLKKPVNDLTKEELKHVQDAFPFILLEAETK